MTGRTCTDEGFAGRLSQVMDDHGVPNTHALAVDLGLKGDSARVYAWRRQKTVPGYASIRAILERYPDVDARWLLGCSEAEDD